MLIAGDGNGFDAEGFDALNGFGGCGSVFAIVDYNLRGVSCGLRDWRDWNRRLTLAPWEARVYAVAAPMPLALLAPVIIASLPARYCSLDDIVERFDRFEISSKCTLNCYFKIEGVICSRLLLCTVA